MKYLCGLASFDNVGTRSFFRHICFPLLERLDAFFERVPVEMDIKLFYVADLRVVERADVLNGFSQGRKVGKAKADDTFCGLESECRLELHIVMEQWCIEVAAIPGVSADQSPAVD